MRTIKEVFEPTFDVVLIMRDSRKMLDVIGKVGIANLLKKGAGSSIDLIRSYYLYFCTSGQAKENSYA